MKFVKAVAMLALTGPDRTFAIAAAVASSVADYAPLPAAPMPTSSDAYLQNGSAAVRGMVGYFNEAAPFDVRLALELGRKFWMTRYETVHSRRMHDATEGDYFCGYFNVGRNFSKSDVECMNKLSKEINTLEIYIRGILQDEEARMNQEKLNTTLAGGVEAGIAVPAPAY